MTDRVGHWMQTVSGRMFWPLDPRPEDFSIHDIAHALSMVCRFGGHTPTFYSVAEHSCRVAMALLDGHERRIALYGLLHDAAEAYLGDVVWPLKQSRQMEGYKSIEARVERVIFERFMGGDPAPPIRDAIKHFDLVLLATEKRDLMTHGHGDASREAAAAWHSDGVEPLKERIEPWVSHEARQRFLLMYACLGGHL
jgi:5'-deoxynucleotidase YfbR-like HD superfamily hydrolase